MDRRDDTGMSGRGTLSSGSRRPACKTARLLLVQNDNIGDLVLSTPFIRVLRTRLPQARIDALVNSYNAQVLDGNPHVDAIFVYMKSKHRPRGRTWWQSTIEMSRLVRAIRAVRYDLAILMHRGFSRHALKLALVSGARRIAGFTNGRDAIERLIDVPVPSAAFEHQHIAQRAAALLPAIEPLLHMPPQPDVAMPGCEVFPAPALRTRFEADMMASGILPSRHVVAVQVSARKLDQRWPAERFVELIRHLHASTGCAILLLWSPGAADSMFHPGDDAKAYWILKQCHGLPIYPMHATSVSQMIAGLSLADLVITSDGGAMHIAAGLQLPIVCLFGSTILEHWHPWGSPYIPMRAASHDVMDISVGQVMGAARTLLDSRVAKPQAPREDAPVLAYASPPLRRAEIA